MEIENIIPKKIHYCWFGKGEKPDIVIKCLKTWKLILSDYEIVEWNEENFNIKSNAYVNDAYNQRKFAFVSDYVRLYALYHHGGIYLDTDVEVLKSFDPLLKNETFWGFEQGNYIATSTIGSVKGHKFIEGLLNMYEDKTFLKSTQLIKIETNVVFVTKVLKEKGLHLDGNSQYIPHVGVVYPRSYFSPIDYINISNLKDDETYAIHHFHKSWMPLKAKIKYRLKVIIAYFIGGERIRKLRKLFTGL